MSQKKLILFYVAIIFQFFSCIDFYCVNSYLQSSQQHSDVFYVFNKLDVSYWLIACFLGRLAGAYAIGKYALRAGFFGSMHLISALFVVFTALFAVSCFSQDYSFDVDNKFYFFRFFYCFLQPAALILPSIYLLNTPPISGQAMISAGLVLAIFIAATSKKPNQLLIAS